MATKIEVAKLFSKMGFEIDTTQLEKFEQLTRTIRTSTVKLARDLRQTNNQLTSVSSKLKTVNSGLNSVNSRKGAGNLAQSYASLSKNVNVSQTALNRFSSTVTAVEPKLATQTSTVARLAQQWGEYAIRVKEANRQLRDRPSGQPPRPPSGGGAGSGGGRPSGAGGGGVGAGLAGGAMARMAGHFINPAYMAGAGGAYAVKEVIKVGREYQKMKQVLLASSKNQEEFNMHLKFTEETTNRLGTNVTEFGSAYAKMLQAVGGKLKNEETQGIFTKFSELMVVLGSSDDDQKGIFRAMSQMFSKGKIQMEEINQMAERNVPALAMMTRAYKELGMTTAEFEKAQREGKLDPTKFMPLFGKYAREFATNNDALQKAMDSSVTQQGIFMNQMRKLSNQIMEAGLDKALGQMFKGLTALGTAFAPLAIWITKATLGLIEFIKAIYDFAKAHPIIAGLLGTLLGGFVGLRMAMRAGITVGGAFFVAMVRGLQMLKVAMIKTAILAVFIGIAEVLVALYDHMNGDKNWLSVTIGWFELLGLKIKSVWLDFQMLISALTRGIKDSWVGRFFEKIFSFDFGDTFKGAGDAYADGAGAQTVPQVPMRQAGQNPLALSPEQLNTFKQNMGYSGQVPMGNGNKMFGNMNVGYKLEIVNGKQVITSTNTQTVNIGGLKK